MTDQTTDHLSAAIKALADLQSLGAGERKRYHDDLLHEVKTLEPFFATYYEDKGRKAAEAERNEPNQGDGPQADHIAPESVRKLQIECWRPSWERAHQVRNDEYVVRLSDHTAALKRFSKLVTAAEDKGRAEERERLRAWLTSKEAAKRALSILDPDWPSFVSPMSRADMAQLQNAKEALTAAVDARDALDSDQDG